MFFICKVDFIRYFSEEDRLKYFPLDDYFEFLASSGKNAILMENNEFRKRLRSAIRAVDFIRKDYMKHDRTISPILVFVAAFIDSQSIKNVSQHASVYMAYSNFLVTLTFFGLSQKSQLT